MIRQWLARAWCALSGHAWTGWSQWEHDRDARFYRHRRCLRCAAVEDHVDGEQGVVHA